MSKFSAFAAALSNGIFLNPFDYISSDDDVREIIEIVFSATDHKVVFRNLLFENSEYLFLQSNFLYLLQEAPDDEQNMFMIAELFAAGYNSDDLDRLFKLLREKKKPSTALKAYDDFVLCSDGNKNEVVRSCWNRILPISCEMNALGDLLSHVQREDEIENYAKSFLANTQRQLTTNKPSLLEDCLLRYIITLMFRTIEQGERGYSSAMCILNDLENDIEIARTRDYLPEFSTFFSADIISKKEAISCLKTRFGFWKPYH